MSVDQPLLLTKLRPPRPNRQRLERPRLSERLGTIVEHRLTLVQAPAGYGKTTLLGMLGADPNPPAWYTLGEEDADPPRFLAYLLAALAQRLPQLSPLPSALLEELRAQTAVADWTPVIDALANALEGALVQPLLLVLDDCEPIARQPALTALLARLLQHQPELLHLVMVSRQPVELQGLHTWRARGEVLEITRHDLALSPEETSALLCEVHGAAIEPEEARALHGFTEGWPIAVQLIGQSLQRRGTSAAATAQLLRDSQPEHGALFGYLAEEIFGAQPPSLRRFLTEISVLRRLDDAACAAVTGRADAAATLQLLADQDLFVTPLGEGHYRFHQLFHAFLQSRPEAAEGRRVRHQLAARHYDRLGDRPEAIYHYLQAEDFDAAAEAVEGAGEEALAAGRLDTVGRWVEALPAAVRQDHPALEIYLADIARLRGRFDEALERYRGAEAAWRERGQRAGVARSLRGQALVYLDTVRATQAQGLLEAALELTDPEQDAAEHRRLLMLLAENRVNLGQPAQAEALWRQARSQSRVLPGEEMLQVRILVRSGRLQQARELLRQRWREELKAGADGHSPRSHRETGLMLSLVASMTGDAAQARDCARSTVSIGQQLRSPLVVGLAYARLGHAWQITAPDPAGADLAASREQALAAYQEAAGWFERLDVRRARAELMLGVARLRGLAGDLEAAREAAAEAAEVARWAGDSWLEALVQLTEATALVSAGRIAQALLLLEACRDTVRAGGDRHTEAACLLWLAMAHHAQDEPAQLEAAGARLLELCEADDRDFLLTRATLFGLPDPHRALPMLLALRRAGVRVSYIDALLTRLGLPELRLHPGYRLGLRALGGFEVWRGEVEVDARAWRRSIARELFQLLLSKPGRWFQRDELMEALRPESSPERARSDFKAALNSLNKAIEPVRCSDEAFAYIDRDQTAYRIRPQADLWYDVSAFESAARRGLEADEMATLERAVTLYRGDYLPEAPAHDWVLAERERLRELYLRAGCRLAALQLEDGRANAALELAQTLLGYDPCWEEAHRLVIRALAGLGNRAAALRAFETCAARLRAELDVEPAPATRELQRQLLEQDPS